jgi:serine/threonine-protein kinase
VGGGWTAPGYTHDGQLGFGIGGRVMLAGHKATGAAVAIKYLSGPLCADRVALSRVRTTARALAELDDRHLVRIHEYVEGPRAAAIVMELVDGITLQHLIGAAGTIGPQAALTVFKRSLSGLAAAHRIGVVHGGYKPTNVLIGADGVSRLTGFGIAGPGLFAAGVPVYLAPERWDERPATPAADLYAATAVFYECLTGDPPFPGRTTALLGAAHRTEPIPLERVPAALRGLLARGLAKEPADRPPVTAFLADLDEVATAAYGPGWERQGCDRLAELAAPLARLFPLTRSPHRPRTRAVPIARRQGWVQATAGAVLIGLATGAALAVAAAGEPKRDGTFNIERVGREPMASTNPSPALTRAAATESDRGAGPSRVVRRKAHRSSGPPTRSATPTHAVEPSGGHTVRPTPESSGGPETTPIVVPSSLGVPGDPARPTIPVSGFPGFRLP